jgi:nicotinamidase-related amidase
MIELDPKSTALVLIDLQKGILGNTLTPIAAHELLARGQTLAERFRAAKATVVLVNVAFSADGGDMLRQRVDQAPAVPAGGGINCSPGLRAWLRAADRQGRDDQYRG